MSKRKNFVFTIYNVNEDESDKLKELYNEGFAKYLTFTHELGKKDDNPHIQGYISLNYSINFLALKNKINKVLQKDVNPHIEEAKDTAYKNYEYITKELIEKPNIKHVILGNKPLPPRKGKDKDKFDYYGELLRNGEITIKEIKEQDPLHYTKREQYYLSLISLLKKQSIQQPTFNVWFFGKDSLGKEKTAYNIAKVLGLEVYDISIDNNYFSNYEGQDCSIWANYEPNKITINGLVKHLNENGTTLNTKGNKLWFNPKIQIFTSVLSIDQLLKIRNEKDKQKISERRSEIERIKTKIRYHVEYIYENPELEEIKQNADTFISNEDLPIIIPSEELRNEVINEVTHEFLRVYKYFLLKNDLEDMVNSIPVLKDLEPLEYKTLVPMSNRGKIVFKSNIS